MTSPPARPPAAAYRFTFHSDVSLSEAEATLRLAILAVEGLYGEARVRLDAAYQFEPDARALLVDASTPVGSALVGVFLSLVIKEFGGGAVSVGRVTGDVESGVAR